MIHSTGTKAYCESMSITRCFAQGVSCKWNMQLCESNITYNNYNSEWLLVRPAVIIRGLYQTYSIIVHYSALALFVIIRRRLPKHAARIFTLRYPIRFQDYFLVHEQSHEDLFQQEVAQNRWWVRTRATFNRHAEIFKPPVPLLSMFCLCSRRQYPKAPKTDRRQSKRSHKNKVLFSFYYSFTTYRNLLEQWRTIKVKCFLLVKVVLERAYHLIQLKYLH